LILHLSLEGLFLAALCPFWDSLACCGNHHICTAISRWGFGLLLLLPFLHMEHALSMLYSILI
jgi:hypothetical protein